MMITQSASASSAVAQREDGVEAQPRERVSLQGHCALYAQAKAQARQLMGPHAHVWLEAHPPAQAAQARSSHADSISYAVHASQKASDVPPFAIEVYEHGALAQYEVNRQRIQELALMSETERQTVITASKLRAQFMDTPEMSPHAAPGCRM